MKKKSALFFVRLLSVFCLKIDPFVLKTPKPILSENRPAKKNPYSIFLFFFTFLHRTFYRNVRKHTFESVFHYIFIKKSATKPTTTHFIHSMYILNFVREFVRKCPKPQKFCPKMSEDQNHFVRKCPKPLKKSRKKSLTNRVVVCFHNQKSPFKTKDLQKIYNERL